MIRRKEIMVSYDHLASGIGDIVLLYNEGVKKYVIQMINRIDVVDTVVVLREFGIWYFIVYPHLAFNRGIRPTQILFDISKQ